MNDKIIVPQEASEGLKGSMNQGDAIQLPFPVAYFYVRNGSKQLKSGIGYFGGFNVGIKDLDDLLSEIPDVFTPQAYEGKEGVYEVYEIRNLLVAPITKRYRWVENRSNQQIVAMLGVIVDKQIVNLGPSVLSAKGMQTKYVNAALKEWDHRTLEARRQFADGAESKFFWATIGTFADQPEFTTVGKGKNTSEVTPMKLQPKPVEITAEVLNKRYVGESVALEMAELYTQCAEWIADWKKDKKEDGAPPPPENFEEEEFPF